MLPLRTPSSCVLSGSGHSGLCPELGTMVVCAMFLAEWHGGADPRAGFGGSVLAAMGQGNSPWGSWEPQRQL